MDEVKRGSKLVKIIIYFTICQTHQLCAGNVLTCCCNSHLFVPDVLPVQEKRCHCWMWSQTLQEVLPLPVCCSRRSSHYWGCRGGEICVSPTSDAYLCINDVFQTSCTVVCLSVGGKIMFNYMFFFCASGCTATHTTRKCKVSGHLFHIHIFFNIHGFIFLNSSYNIIGVEIFPFWPERNGSTDEPILPNLQTSKKNSKTAPSKVWLMRTTYW